MKNTNEELIVEAFPNEQYIEKLIQNDPSSIEKIILKYFKDCPKGMQRVEDYEEYLVNQLMYCYYHNLLDHYLEELTTQECQDIIEDQQIMLDSDKAFLIKNQYYLKQFPIYKCMNKKHYLEEKHYTKEILIPKLIQQIKKNKKENGII